MILDRIKQAGRALGQHYREAKAELEGIAISRARMIKALRDINRDLLRKRGTTGPAQPTNIVLRMMDGKPMRYFNDGSLRHLVDKISARKAAKAARREARRVQRQEAA